MEPLYIIVRQDLKPGQQLAQAVHAMRQFSEEWPDVDREWFAKSNTIVILNIDHEQALDQLKWLAEDKALCVSAFYEPDLGDSLTAIAIGPDPQARELCSELDLALSAAYA